MKDKKKKQYADVSKPIHSPPSDPVEDRRQVGIAHKTSKLSVYIPLMLLVLNRCGACTTPPPPNYSSTNKTRRRRIARSVKKQFSRYTVRCTKCRMDGFNEYYFSQQ